MNNEIIQGSCGKGNDMTTREKLMESGRRFFLKYGYKSASLRRIVADAGYTCGAFYGYFSSKEDLFYAITDVVAEGLGEKLEAVSREINALPPERRLYEMGRIYIKRIPDIVDFLLKYPEETKMLLTCSEGTKYEDFMERMQRDHIIAADDMYSAAARGTCRAASISPYTTELLTSGYFYILSKVLLEKRDKESICRCMREISIVFEQGMLSLMRENR